MSACWEGAIRGPEVCCANLWRDPQAGNTVGLSRLNTVVRKNRVEPAEHEDEEKKRKEPVLTNKVEGEDPRLSEVRRHEEQPRDREDSPISEYGVNKTKQKTQKKCHKRYLKNMLNPIACRLHAHTTITTNMIGSESKVHCGSTVRFGRAFSGILTTTHHAYAFLL